MWSKIHALLVIPGHWSENLIARMASSNKDALLRLSFVMVHKKGSRGSCVEYKWPLAMIKKDKMKANSEGTKVFGKKQAMKIYCKDQFFNRFYHLTHEVRIIIFILFWNIALKRIIIFFFYHADRIQWTF